MNSAIRAMLQEFRSGVTAVYGSRLKGVFLFGSQARGDSTSASDVDVLIVLSGAVAPGEEIRRTGALTSSLSLKYQSVLSRTFVAQDRYESEQSPLLINVRQEGIAV